VLGTATGVPILARLEGFHLLKGANAMTETVQVRRMRAFPTLLGAVAFLVIYLAVSPVTNVIAPLPLPDAPPAEVYAYFTDSGAASILTGVLQLLSVAGLAVFVTGCLRLASAAPQRRGFRVLGWLAVAAMAVSCAIAIFLGVGASTLSSDAVMAWRQASFYTGGVVHVVALGGLALTLALWPGWTRPVRVVAWIAAVPALLSIASLIWYYASILLPVGRLLAMVAFIVAGGSLVRGRSLASLHAAQR
jgi:hypothetical protein